MIPACEGVIMELRDAFDDTQLHNLIAQGENEQKDDTTVEYHLREYLSGDFAPTMLEYAQSILEECHYSDLLKATFNFTNFDIMVNGEDKGTSHGKGYRSYLSMVMILMLRKYLANTQISIRTRSSSARRSMASTMVWMRTCRKACVPDSTDTS